MQLKDETSIKKSKAQIIMQNMGHVEGKGLGKNEQGTLDPVETLANRQRRGLGHESFQRRKYDEGINLIDQWKPEDEAEFVSLDESIDCIACGSNELNKLTVEQLYTWTVKGTCEMKPIDSYTGDDELFCDFETFIAINQAKKELDSLNDQEIIQGRTASNPFEGIGKGIFQNRAAMKIANIDACFDFMLTNPLAWPQDEFEKKLKTEDILYFVDICAGPGGFSEYVLWKRKWLAHGFGMTLKSGTDWKLEDFLVAPTETFEIHYGHPSNDDGDIYKEANLKEFNQHIMRRTNGRGVNFVMADGGFSVEGTELFQEVLSKRLYLCQFLCGLNNTKTGGHFVCKLFDCFTQFTVSLIYLMYLSFDSICIFKPNTSRPANSERYLVCKNKKSSTLAIEKYLIHINRQLEPILNMYDLKKNVNKIETDDVEDIISLVPFEIIRQDDKFYSYICNSNNVLGKRQIFYLKKMKIFALNLQLPNEFNGRFNEESFKKWLIPINSFYRENFKNSKYNNESAKDFCASLEISPKQIASYYEKPSLLTFETIAALTKSIYSYQFALISGPDPTRTSTVPCYTKDTVGERGLILIMHKTKCYFFTEGKWQDLTDKHPNLIVNLPPRTLVYGEVTWELEGQGHGRRKIKCLHFIDPCFLGGFDFRDETIEVRSKCLGNFIESIQTICHPQSNPFTFVRHRKLFNLPQLEQVISQLKKFQSKSSQPRPCLSYVLDEKKYMTVTGVLFILTVNDGYTKQKSTKSKNSPKYYYWNEMERNATFEIPEKAKMKVENFHKNSFFLPLDFVLRNENSLVYDELIRKIFSKSS